MKKKARMARIELQEKKHCISLPPEIATDPHLMLLARLSDNIACRFLDEFIEEKRKDDSLDADFVWKFFMCSAGALLKIIVQRTACDFDELRMRTSITINTLSKHALAAIEQKEMRENSPE